MRAFLTIMIAWSLAAQPVMALVLDRCDCCPVVSASLDGAEADDPRDSGCCSSELAPAPTTPHEDEGGGCDTCPEPCCTHVTLVGIAVRSSTPVPAPDSRRWELAPIESHAQGETARLIRPPRASAQVS